MIAHEISCVIGMREDRYASRVAERDVETVEHRIAAAEDGIGAAAAAAADEEGQGGPVVQGALHASKQLLGANRRAGAG